MRTYIRGLFALSIIVATLSAAGTAYASAPSVSAQCDSKTGTSVVVSFDTDRVAASWGLYSDAGSVTFGETDSVPTDKSGRWTQTVAVDAGVEYTWAVTTADLGARLAYSWEWVNEETASMVFSCNPNPTVVSSNPVIEEEFYRPTPGFVTFLSWIRDVYSRELVGCSNIGVKGFGPC